MKKILAILAIAIMPLTTLAQDFPGEKVTLLEGKQLKVKPMKASLQEYGYNNFYTDEALKKIYKKKSTSTPYDKLESRVFNFVSAIPYTNSIGANKYKLKIENEETGILYFDYDPRFSHSFPFEVIGGLVYPEGFFCEQLLEKRLPDGTQYFAFPFADGVEVSCLERKGPTAFLKINLPTSQKVASDIILRGLLLTFDDGSTFELPEQEVQHVARTIGGTLLSVMFAVKGDVDLQSFKNSKLTTIKLNKFERDFKEGMVLQEYINCVTE
ncbi:hypothetical protein [Flavobacterium rhizosphaerae]|uniref:GLPGLI family protein n=1 Tax=Flavobacterium rhizosphaerae TaxID=3163298 RepID=A0ABW8Z0C2_9FLAO